jgi:hypothetical protein
MTNHSHTSQPESTDRLGFSPPAEKNFARRLMFASTAQSFDTPASSRGSFTSLSKSFVKKRIWKFRRQEMLVGIFELTFVVAGIWLLVKGFQ